MRSTRWVEGKVFSHNEAQFDLLAKELSYLYCVEKADSIFAQLFGSVS